nr:MAG TPA: hypothetical protein [Crassvirales sp.]
MCPLGSYKAIKLLFLPFLQYLQKRKKYIKKEKI